MRIRANLWALGLFVWAFATATTWAGDIYVDGDAPGGNNGSSWYNAYHYLQDALITAQYGDVIRVAQGVYRPNQATGIIPTGRSATFTMRTGVALMGGYAGYGATNPDLRDPSFYPSLLSGDLNGDDWSVDPNDHTAIGQLLTASVRQDNCYNVVTASYTNWTASLDGFTIIGGTANGTTATRGGGIVSYQGSPTLRNCTIKACAASDSGGGMYSSQGDPNVSDCTFVANYAAQYGAGMYNLSSEPNVLESAFEHNLVAFQGKGGGLYNDNSDARIVNCTFKKNYGGGEGGGLYGIRSDPNVVGCTFIENTSRLSGAGIENSTDCRSRITQCQFIANNATNQGGAVSNYASTPRFVSCTFVRNRCGDEGGAVYNYRADPNFINCLFNGNTSDYYGGAISCFQSKVNVINCTFASNEAIGGEAMACSSTQPPDTRSRLVVVNSILWDSGSEIYNNDGSEISVTYSNLYGFWAGMGNLSANPQYTDLDGPDNVEGNEDDKLMLKGNSWCIDAGNNSAVPYDIKQDLSGKTRFIDDPNTANTGKGQPPLVDMGAYEFGTDTQGQNPPIANAGPDQTASAAGNGYANVTLDGSGSYDPDGSSLQYSWAWTIGAQTYHATDVKPSVQLPVGQYQIDLIVYDGTLYSNPDTVQITILQNAGLPPVANAGADQTTYAPAGGYASVTLNGSASYDPEGSPLQYSWTWTVSSQTYHATGVAPTVQFPVGQHTVYLIVYDGTYYSSSDSVRITVLQTGGQPPVANAGADKTAYAPAGGYASVALNGSASYDPEGSPLTYSWTWTVGAQNYNATGVTPTIQLPVGQYQIKLIVYDGNLSSNPDYVQITVLQTGGQPPVANAGADKTAYAPAGGYASVALNGSASYDPEGSPLTYGWTWTVGAQTYNATGATPTIQLPIGQHQISLVVYDGSLYSNPDYVQVTVLQTGGQPPVANAGPDKTAYASAGGYANVTLNGSASYDPEGSPLQYNWKWIIGAQTYNATGVTPTIQLPVGQYQVELIVYDGSLYSNPDYVQVTVLQTGGQPPVANAGPDKTAYASAGGYANVTLNGSASYDPEGSPLTYSWTWIVGAQTYHATGVTPTIQLPVGQFQISLIVYDGSFYSNPDYVKITVLQTGGQPPVANAGPDQTAYALAGEFVDVTLDGSGSYDPEGSPLQHSWTWTIGAQIFDAIGVTPTIQLPVGQHVIELIVFDGSTYSTADYVVVTVAEPQEYPLRLWPSNVNREDRSVYVLALLVLPDISAGEIDLTTPLLLYPGPIQALAQHATETNDGGVTTTVFALFNEEDLLNAIPQDGVVSLTVMGRFIFGQPYSGTATVVLTH